MHKYLIATFVTVYLFEFAAYGMQRAVLLISRESGLPYQIVETMLPSWYPAVWILRIAKWGILIYIAITWSWVVAVGLLVADFILSAILPIPYGFYVPAFRSRINEIKAIDEEAGQALEQILNSSEIHDS